MNARRRERFLAWYAGEYADSPKGRAKFMEDSGLTKGRVTQLLKDPNEPGERAARNLALKVGKPPNFFERDPGSLPDLTGLAIHLGQMLDRYKDDSRKHMAIFQAMQAAFEKAAHQADAPPAIERPPSPALKVSPKPSRHLGR